VIVKIEKRVLAGLQAIETTARAFVDAVERAGAAPAIAPLLDEFHRTSASKKVDLNPREASSSLRGDFRVTATQATSPDSPSPYGQSPPS
jgi:hypothetical protein